MRRRESPPRQRNNEGTGKTEQKETEPGKATTEGRKKSSIGKLSLLKYCTEWRESECAYTRLRTTQYNRKKRPYLKRQEEFIEGQEQKRPLPDSVEYSSLRKQIGRP